MAANHHQGRVTLLVAGEDKEIRLTARYRIAIEDDLGMEILQWLTSGKSTERLLQLIFFHGLGHLSMSERPTQDDTADWIDMIYDEGKDPDTEHLRVCMECIARTSGGQKAANYWKIIKKMFAGHYKEEKERTGVPLKTGSGDTKPSTGASS